MYNSFPYFLSMNTTQMSILILFQECSKIFLQRQEPCFSTSISQYFQQRHLRFKLLFCIVTKKEEEKSLQHYLQEWFLDIEQVLPNPQHGLPFFKMIFFFFCLFLIQYSSVYIQQCRHLWFQTSWIQGVFKIQSCKNCIALQMTQ